MILRFAIAVLVCVVATVALAEQPSPESQALAQKLMGEINANIQCGASVITLQQQIAAKDAQIKALTDKYEPKKDEKK